VFAEQKSHGANLLWWTPRHATRDVWAYAAAGAWVGAAVSFRWIFRGWFDGNVPYLHFFPAILIAAWHGGLGPGILATALSALAAMYFFLPPPGLAVGGVPDVMSLGLFVADRAFGVPPRGQR
jgi:K+-sensing histidine kinase KdpD